MNNEIIKMSKWSWLTLNSLSADAWKNDVNKHQSSRHPGHDPKAQRAVQDVVHSPLRRSQTVCLLNTKFVQILAISKSLQQTFIRQTKIKLRRTSPLLTQTVLVLTYDPGGDMLVFTCQTSRYHNSSVHNFHSRGNLLTSNERRVF